MEAFLDKVDRLRQSFAVTFYNYFSRMSEMPSGVLVFYVKHAVVKKIYISNVDDVKTRSSRSQSL